MKRFIGFGLALALGLMAVADAQAQCRRRGAYYSHDFTPYWTSSGHYGGPVVSDATVPQTTSTGNRIGYSSAYQPPVQQPVVGPTVTPMRTYMAPTRSYRSSMRGGSITDQMEAGRRSIKGF